MATVDFTGGGAVGAGAAYGLESKLSIKRARVDTAKTGITNTNADVYQAIKCPAGTKVIDAWFNVVKPETGAVTAQFELGETNDPDGFVKTVTCAAKGVKTDNTAAYVISGGYTFATDGTIDLVVSIAAFTDCVVDVYALVLDKNPNAELK